MKFNVKSSDGETGTLEIIAESDKEKSVLAGLVNDLKESLCGSHYELSDVSLSSSTPFKADGDYEKINCITYSIKAKE